MPRPPEGPRRQSWSQAAKEMTSIFDLFSTCSCSRDWQFAQAEDGGPKVLTADQLSDESKIVGTFVKDSRAFRDSKWGPQWRSGPRAENKLSIAVDLPDFPNETTS